MSKIAEFWEYVTLYYVEFTLVKGDTIGIHRELLTLKSGFLKEEINELVNLILTILLK